MVEPAFVPAISALVGTFVGGITSIATSWISQQKLSQQQRITQEKVEREVLYKRFIQEACKLYLHSLEHDTSEIAKLVDVYATLNLIRVLSPSEVVEEAHRALQTILGMYSMENKTFSDITRLVHEGFIDPLLPFSEACQKDLKRYS
jgi:hypothetical protein